LEKEMNSFWYPNKDRKAVKVAGLKELLKVSATTRDMPDAIATIS
jgi:hypothetical protein